MRRKAFDAEVIEQLPDVLRRVDRPVEIRCVELDDLVAGLRHRGDGALQVFLKLVAHGVQLEADGNVLQPRRQARGRERQRAGDSQKCPT